MSTRGSVTKRRRRKGWAYEARWYEDDQQRSRSFNTAADANAFLNDVLTKLNRGEQTTWAGASITLDEHFRAWMERPARATTLSRDRQVMQRNFLPKLGGVPLAKIKPTHVQAAVKEMESRLAPATVRTNYGVLRACLAAAVEDDLIARSPCRGVRLPAEAEDKEEVRFLEPGELDRLAAAVPEAYRALIYVAGVLGLRWSECVGLRVDAVDLLKRMLTVKETMSEVNGKLVSAPTKTKASRRSLHMPAFVAHELAQHLQRRRLTAANGDALIFTAPEGGPLRRMNFRRRVFGPAVAAAGLDGLTFHGLRHTAAGLMISLGYQPGVIQKRLGHASIRTTMDVYGHLLPSTDATVADGLDRLWVSPEGATASSRR